ncbi:GerMN domain-containing protein [Pseudanabaena galeata UHCC 0370]|jgi:spore germination protein GerM|uniref:GerMN domain-containing protein n=1 Tax=Pseudanabaena galeata UHCC 0370 TaxID=3110310 RepID=A0ABU5TKV5_9CYAN|nr:MULTISPECIES: GerMN domain-containing protein [Pseudanabaena]MEA5478904.1 GerMN domain-containing protein [Pseudanabaena galeata UHCC 0370]MEA5489200.1 GerMN domain-containing protein [Pseudanabaena sp. CCNP1317]WGS73785.1 GerMN domain-containing protein [Pseudanabaena galeata CCNP1313]
MKIPVLSKSTWFALVAAAVVGGSSAAVLVHSTLNNQPNSQSSVPSSINQVAQSPSATRAVDGELAVYWIEASSNKLTAVPIAVKAKSNDEAIASVINMLITEKPPETELYSAIPESTKVLSSTSKNKEIRIDLSKDFTKGGGSASMQGRIIQVLYTATTLEPDAKVYLSVEGKPLKYIGGEGLEVPQPMTRKDFALEF